MTPRTIPFITGYVICVLLGLADLVGVAGINVEGAPPAALVITGGVLGLVTLAAAVPAWRGGRPAVLIVAVSRALSGLLTLPAFFVDAPGWARVIAAAMLVLTVAGVAFVSGAVRQRALAR
jgi:hypothetical protein